MRRRFALGLAASLLSASALAQTSAPAGSYPVSRSNADVVAWLRRDTPLDPAKVVDVSPSSITEITSYEPTNQPPGFIAILHAEALDPTIEKQEGILSWAIPVEVDCATRRVRLGAMTGFPGRDIRYGPKAIRAADDDWVAPAPKAPLDNVLRALCDRSFPRPLAGVQIAAQSAGQPASPSAARQAPPTAPQQAPRPAPVPTPAASAPATAQPPAPRPAPQPSLPPATAAATGPVISAGVQVGGTPDPAEARTILNRVRGKFASQLQDLKIDVVTATVDQKTIYRVVISGFHAMSDANRLCTSLKAGGHACFVRG